MTPKPTAQYDDRTGDPTRDLARDGFSLHALERMLSDIGGQPDWRSRSSLCHAYYDGKQLTAKQRQMIVTEGLDERVTNLVRPVINSVLGQEAKTRVDIKLECDNDDFQDVVDALAPKLKEAERETCAHMAISNAYAAMVKGGIGWVEVARNADPLSYPYRIEDVPRNEIWWDWRGQRGNTMDRARWLVRKRFIDLDELQATMPKHREVLARAVSGWDSLVLDDTFLNEPDDRMHMLHEAHDNERRFTLARTDWVDTARKMVKIYEVWYRVPATVAIIQRPGARAVQYDPADQRHVEAVARGLVQVSKSVTSQIRMSLYAGPHRLLDMATTKKKFPYIPFFAFRDEDDGSPYGLIDGMVSPQDEYNERRLRLQWMLKAKQIDIDNDALDTRYNSIADVAANAMRPDMVTVLKADRKHAAGVVRRNDISLQREQVDVMQDAKQLIQDVSGRYTSQLGSAPGQVTSGIANSLLIDQGEQSMGEMNDNYAFARRTAFELLVDEIARDHSSADLEVSVGAGRTKRKVVLNGWDAQTQAPINMVKDAEVKVGLAEVPSSPAYRQQQQQQIAQIIQALGSNPQAVALLAPAYIESSGLADRKELADDMRRASGLPIAGDREGQAQAQAQQAEQQAEQAQMAKAAMQAELQDKASRSQLAQAQARKLIAEAMQTEQQVQQQSAVAEAAARTAKTDSDAALNQARIAEIAARLDAAVNPPRDPARDIDEALSEAAFA